MEPRTREHLLRRHDVVLRRRVADAPVDPAGPQAVEPGDVRGRLIAVLGVVLQCQAVDGHAQRLAEGDQAVRILRRVQVQHGRHVGRRVEIVEGRGVARHVDPLHVGDEEAGPVDFAGRRVEGGGVVPVVGREAQRTHFDFASLPVGGVTAQVVALRREVEDTRERAGADRIGVGPVERILHPGPDVRGHDVHVVHQAGKDTDVHPLEVDGDGVAGHRHAAR